jgi:hypothetical protein
MGALGIRFVPETAFSHQWRFGSCKRCSHTIALLAVGERDSRSCMARALPNGTGLMSFGAQGALGTTIRCFMFGSMT